MRIKLILSTHPNFEYFSRTAKTSGVEVDSSRTMLCIFKRGNKMNLSSSCMKALIYKSTGSWYFAKNEEGRQYNARIKGVLKISGLTSTNPIAVGDLVEMEIENDQENTAT